MRRHDVIGGFDFYRHFGIANNRIHLVGVVQCVPERELFLRFRIIKICSQFLNDKMFECVTIFGCSPLEFFAVQQIVCDAHIKEIEFWGHLHFAFDCLGIGGHEHPHQRFLQDGVVFLDGFGRDPAIAGNSGVIHHFRIAQRSHFQKTGERIEVAYQRFRNDFLL